MAGEIEHEPIVLSKEGFDWLREAEAAGDPRVEDFRQIHRGSLLLVQIESARSGQGETHIVRTDLGHFGELADNETTTALAS